MVVMCPSYLHAASSPELQRYDVGSLPGQLSIDQGAANYAIPIGVPPGIAGVEPELAFAYTSRGGSGPMGVGWSISGQSSITRCERTHAQDGFRLGIQWKQGDRYCLDGQRLILISGKYGAGGSVYRTEIDGFARITAKGQRGNGPDWFVVETKSGQTMEYGNTPDSKIIAAGKPAVFAWARSKILDAAGNEMTYEYGPDQGHLADHVEFFLRKIRYANNNNRVVFNYRFLGEPHAQATRYLRGVVIKQTRQLESVEIFAQGKKVSSYRLSYDPGETPRERLLRSVMQCSGEEQQDAGCLPPVTFSWMSSSQSFAAPKSWSPPINWNQGRYLQHGDENSTKVLFLDVDTDGLPDKVFDRNPSLPGNGGIHVMRNIGHRFANDVERWHQDYAADWKNALSYTNRGSFNQQEVRIADIDGDGLPDKLFSRDPVAGKPLVGLYARLNTGTGFASAVNWKLADGSEGYAWDRANALMYESFHSKTLTDSDGHQMVVSGHRRAVDLVDMDGDGLLDKVTTGPPNSASNRGGLYVMRNDGQSFGAPEKWLGLLKPAWKNYISCENCDLRFVSQGGSRLRMQLLDVNGDGLPDKVVDGGIGTSLPGVHVWLNNGNGFDERREWFAGSIGDGAIDYQRVSYARNGVFVDMNGDGLPDILLEHDHDVIQGPVTELQVMINTGEAFLEPVRWYRGKLSPAWANGASYNDGKHAGLIDMNGDGLPDKVLNRKPNASEKQRGVYVMLNTGSGFLGATRWLGSRSKDGTFVDQLWAGNSESTHVQFIDINGDGRPDKVFDRDPFASKLSAKPGRTHVLLNQSRPALLTKITGSLLDVIRITYEPGATKLLHQRDVASKYPGVGIPQGWLVASVEKDNGQGAYNATDYRYGGAKLGIEGRGFLGMAWDEATDRTTGLTTLTRFSQDFPTVGMPVMIQTFTKANVTIAKSTFDYRHLVTVPGKAVLFPYLYKKTETTFELDGSTALKVTTRQTGYDRHGNVGKVVVDTEADGKRFTKITESHYDNRTDSRWHLGRLKLAEVVHRHPGGDEIRRVSSFAYGENGLLKHEVIEPFKAGLWKRKSYAYDAAGNRVKITIQTADGGQRVTHTTYDQNRQFVRKITNPLSHAELRRQDPRTGKLLELQGPNGLTTRWEYDRWGRQTREYRADDTGSVIERSWVKGGKSAPEGAVYRVQEQTLVTFNSDGSVKSSAGKPVDKYYDRLGRVVRKRTFGFDGRWVYQDYLYDGQGRIQKASLPYFSDESPYWVTSAYDLKGRLKRKSFSSDRDTVVTNYLYQGLSVTEKRGLADANARRIKITRKNALGKVSEVIDEAGARVTYEYDAIGNLRFTHQHDDNHGKVVSTELRYDTLGRKTEMIDPDMGVWKYQYNGFDELIYQTDAKGVTTKMSYDQLGRTTLRQESDGVTRWHYDSAVGAGIGKLASVELFDLTHGSYQGQAELDVRIPVYRKVLEYDRVGRAVARVVEIDDRHQRSEVIQADNPLLNLREEMTYDVLGRVNTTRTSWTRDKASGKLTQSFRLKHVYDRNGFLLAKLSPKSEIGDYNSEHLKSLYTDVAQHLDAAIGQASAYTDEYQWLLDREQWYRKLIDSATARQLAKNGVVPRDKGGYNIYKKEGATGAIYFETRRKFAFAGSLLTPLALPLQHYHLIRNAQGSWSIKVLNHDQWQELRPKLVATGQKAFVGDVDGDGNDDFRRVSQGSFDGVLDEKIVKKLHSLADDIRSAADALAADINKVLFLAEELVQVAAALQDKIRQADYWEQSSEKVDLQKMADNEAYMTWWRATARDAAGRVTAHRSGNGLITISDYDPATGHLNTIQTGNGIGKLERHLEYDYDEFNNVTSKADMIQGVEESFKYDRLDRLIQSQVEGFFEKDLNGNSLNRIYNKSVRYSYDALGNVLNNSAINNEDWVYGVDSDSECGMGYPAHGIKRVRWTGNASKDCFNYDNNGNLLAGYGRQIEWTSFNKPKLISKPNAGASVRFAYGPERARFRKDVSNDEGVSTTIYLGKTYELVKKPDGSIEHNYFVNVDGRVVAKHTQLQVGNRLLPDADTSVYLHHDALGSVDTVTNGEGVVLERLSYTPFGSNRRSDWRHSNASSVLASLFTTRGYTGHERLVDVGLIHMNGRVYDPEIGRFLSADPHIQAPYNSQSYNRYSYVLNNPMKYTDPSGYFFKWVAEFINTQAGFVGDNKREVAAVFFAAVGGYAALYLQAGSAAATMSYAQLVKGAGVAGNALAGATAGFVGGFASTGEFNGALKSAVLGGLSAGLAHGIGHEWVLGLSEGVDKAIAHGVAQGIVSELGGRSFEGGFFGGFAGHMASFLPMEDLGVAGRTAVAAVIGGTAAELGGGKFANGAASAAFVHLFNFEGSSALRPPGKLHGRDVIYGPDERFDGKCQSGACVYGIAEGPPRVSNAQRAAAVRELSVVADVAFAAGATASQIPVLQPAAVPLLIVGGTAKALQYGIQPPRVEAFGAGVVDTISSDLVPFRGVSYAIDLIGPAQRLENIYNQYNVN